MSSAVIKLKEHCDLKSTSKLNIQFPQRPRSNYRAQTFCAQFFISQVIGPARYREAKILIVLNYYYQEVFFSSVALARRSELRGSPTSVVSMALSSRAEKFK